MLVDSHCHLDRLDEQPLGAILDNAHSRDIHHFLCVSIQLDQFPSMMDKIAPYPQVFASCGVHPLNQETRYDYDELLRLADHPNVVAIGETGLDYYYAPETKQIQQQSFGQHIDAAKVLKRPLIIHTRDAREDTIRIMDEHNASEVGGVFHCFTESLEMAQQGIERGFYISISGIVTFRNAKALREVVKQIPLDRLLVETDAPYLAPVPHRGKQNQPAYVRDVAEFVADLKGVSLEALAEQTSQNFFNLFDRATPRA